MNKKVLFQIEDIEFFSKRVQNNQQYRNNEIQDLGDSQRIIEGIYDKTTKWGEGVKRRFNGLFHFEPDNRWQNSGYLKKYSWGRLYLNQHGNQDIYYTIGVDSDMKALVIKIDFDRVRSKVLTKDWLKYFDNLLKANKIHKRIIEIDELRGNDEKWLIDETCKYIDSTIHIYQELHRVLFHKILVQSESNTKLMPHYPLNQILYGPPGTGKTYQTVALAYKIVHHLPLEGEIDYTMARTWYKQELAKGHDRQVEFITFHQNYSYEDFIAGIKPALNDDTLGFREHKGIFFEVCQRALKNLQQATQANYQEIPSFQEVFDTFIVDLIQNDRPVEVGLKRGGSFSITKVNAKNIELKKQSGTSEHTLSIQTIEEIYLNKREYLTGLATYYNPLVDKLREIASGLTRSIPAQPLKNYVLIIDEINRANISRVFGELITLLEEDKRWGNDFETEVLLPDGFTKFTVPKNLYIIGTMNTADKSIALLDIALRRRFEFIPLYPDVSMVKDDYQVFFNTLNQIIKDKKGIDFCIGHSYFMPHQGRDFDFVKVMNQKVIPLLTEYFYNARTTQNDVKQLLEDAFRRSGLSFQIEENMFQIIMVGS